MTPTWFPNKDGTSTCTTCSATFTPPMEVCSCPPIVATAADVEPPLTEHPPVNEAGYTADAIRVKFAELIDESEKIAERLRRVKNPRELGAAQSAAKLVELRRRLLASAFEAAASRENVSMVERLERENRLIQRFKEGRYR